MFSAVDRVAAVLMPRTPTSSEMITPASRETDAADDVGRDARGGGVVLGHHICQHEHRGASRDERIGAKARAAAAPLALEADQRSGEHRGSEA